jgi:CO/xanthine dehydrogenase Mo-binding subunit
MKRRSGPGSFSKPPVTVKPSLIVKGAGEIAVVETTSAIANAAFRAGNSGQQKE